jgi:hypothetical protein
MINRESMAPCIGHGFTGVINPSSLMKSMFPACPVKEIDE